MSNCYKRHTI